MLDRRSLLITGVGALAGCASAPEALPDAAADAELRTLVERLAQRPAATRPFLLHRFDATRLTAAGRVLYDALLPGAEAEAALAQRAWGRDGAPYAVTHRNGAYRRAASMRDQDDALRLLARDINEETNTLRADADRGAIAPNFSLSAAIAAVEATQAQLTSAPNDAQAVVVEALTAQIEALRALRPRATAEPGMWRLPDGEAFYAQALQFQLGAAVDPRAAHARALARCHELQTEADTLLRAQGLTHGDVGDRLRALARDPRYLYAPSEAGKAQAIADMNDRLARTRALLANTIEDADVAPGEVQALPMNAQANGAAGRRQGPVYLVDLGAARPRWSLPSVAHHEVLPGHIYQAPYEGAADAPALQVRYAGGYSEGWAIYAEQLADEAGAFADDPAGRIGYLQWMLFRLGRVVADTGIHVMRWSSERAVMQMRALQGESIAFISIEEDVARFCVQPGVYTAQGLAALHFADLREHTRARVRAFSLPRFHTAMLQYGPLSPPGLDQAARAAFA